MEEQKHLYFRIEAEMLKKFRYVYAYEGLSAYSQLLIYIRDSIERFEEKHGEIKLEK